LLFHILYTILLAMKEKDRKFRYAVLKPLVRRRANVADQEALISAFERIDQLAIGGDLLRQLHEVLNDFHQDKSSKSYGNPDSARKSVALAHALYLSRRISKQEYVFFAVYPVENVFDRRMADGKFENELGPINKAIEKIRKDYGLKSDEYWKVGDGPEKYKQLNKKWEAISEKLFLNTLKEFGLNDLTELNEKDPEEFNRLRERGRRAVAHKDEMSLAIRDIVVRYEEDARRAAEAKAYSAAIISLGASLEGLLLLRCFRSQHKAIRTAKKLPRSKRPRYPEYLTTFTFDNLIQVCLKAGWLPTVSTTYAHYNSAGLANILRELRNYVHPARHAKEKPWSEICERDYNDAYAIYIIMLSKVAGIGRRKIKSVANQALSVDAEKPRD